MTEIDRLDLATAFGAELRALRLAECLSQTEAARRVGIARPNFARAERGDHTPQLETLVRAALAFNVDPGELLRRTVQRARFTAGLP